MLCGHGTIGACLEGSAGSGKGIQGWMPQVDDAQEDVDGSNGAGVEGAPPSCRRKPGVELHPQSCRTIGYRARGSSCLDRASAKAARQRGHARSLANDRSTNHQLAQRPRWDSRFWVRAQDSPAVRQRGYKGYLVDTERNSMVMYVFLPNVLSRARLRASLTPSNVSRCCYILLAASSPGCGNRDPTLAPGGF